MYDIAKQEFDEILHNLYQYLVPTFYIQTYLTKPIPELYKKYINKMPKLHNCFTFVMLNNCINLKTDGFLQ
jgi:hypothetical protein